MNIKNSNILTALLGVILGVLITSVASKVLPEKKFDGDYNRWRKLNLILQEVQQNYVDTIDMKSMTDAAVSAALAQLDPHSVYLPPVELTESETELSGNFEGIGITFNVPNDTAIVLSAIPGGPSEKAGLMQGDRIVKVDETVIAGKKTPQDSMIRLMKGPAGTKVKITVSRDGTEIPFDIIRDKIPVHSVDAAFMIDETTGYLKLSKFTRTTYKEFCEASEKLHGMGMKRLIFDLRGNSGGFMDQAILIANEFLGAGQLIVYTEDRNGKQLRQYSDGKGGSTDLKVAVLIDEASASSSEILAGALQDNDRGTIIGRRSFGKGLVQSQTPFKDGSALRLTVARYYTPTGRSIQKPYTAGDGEKYEHDIIDRFNRNEFFSADSIHFADSLRYTTPKGKVVYGGGGIMPDIFVPLDTLNITKYFSQVSGRNILYRYTIDYSDRHRKALEGVKSIAELKALLDSDKSLFNDFVRYAEKQGVKPNWKDINRSRHIMEAQLRAYISRNSDLGENAFYYFIHPIDKTVQRAISELQTESGKQKTEN